MLAPLRRRGRLGGSGVEPVVKSCSPAWPTRQPQTLRPGEKGPWYLGYAAWQLRDPPPRPAPTAEVYRLHRSRALGEQRAGGARLGRREPRSHKERAKPVLERVPGSGFCAGLRRSSGLVGSTGSIIRTLNLGRFIPLKDTSFSVTTPD